MSTTNTKYSRPGGTLGGGEYKDLSGSLSIVPVRSPTNTTHQWGRCFWHPGLEEQITLFKERDPSRLPPPSEFRSRLCPSLDQDDDQGVGHE